eukprot:8319103-Heterocapsa_arctica.AAC.1
MAPSLSFSLATGARQTPNWGSSLVKASDEVSFMAYPERSVTHMHDIHSHFKQEHRCRVKVLADNDHLLRIGFRSPPVSE